MWLYRLSEKEIAKISLNGYTLYYRGHLLIRGAVRYTAANEEYTQYTVL